MQLGMIGLGRMGANLVRRLVRQGHDCVVFDQNAETVTGLAGKNIAGSSDLADLVARARQAAQRLGDAARGRDHRADRGRAGPAAGARRHDHRRRQRLLPGRCAPRPRAEGKGHPLSRLRHQRRRLGPGARLLPDDRRRQGGRGTARPDLRRPQSGRRHDPEDAAARDTRPPGRARLSPLRPERRRSLREDGAQRHRIRADAGLCRGLRDPAQGLHPKPCRPSGATSSTSPTSPKSGAAAASSAPGCSTSPPSALAEDPALSKYSGFVEDSGEGRWTINAAIEEAVPADVLSAALYARFRSRDREGTANKLLSAMRHAFGGHVEPKK